MNNTNFSEKQRFAQPRLWIVLIVVNIIVIGSGLYVFFTRGYEGNEITAIAGIVFPLWVIVLFLVIRLETTIDGSGISYRFFPMHTRARKILWDDVASVTVRRYSPIREYGGWGIRTGFGKTGKAFNIWGNMGIQLVFKDGKKLLIGTQRPEEAATVLQQLRKM